MRLSPTTAGQPARADAVAPLCRYIPQSAADPLRRTILSHAAPSQAKAESNGEVLGKVHSHTLGDSLDVRECL